MATLTGKKALVLGGSRGIGAAIVGAISVIAALLSTVFNQVPSILTSTPKMD